jgi:hypothetical protein
MINPRDFPPQDLSTSAGYRTLEAQLRGEVADLRQTDEIRESPVAIRLRGFLSGGSSGTRTLDPLIKSHDIFVSHSPVIIDIRMESNQLASSYVR